MAKERFTSLPILDMLTTASCREKPYFQLENMMSIKQSLVAATLAAASLFIVTSASAQDTTIFIRNFDVQLIDLTPDDGIDPSISFFAQTTAAGLNRYGNPFLSGTPVESASLNAAGSIILGTFFSADISGTQADLLVNVPENSADGFTRASIPFILGANTQVTISVLASVYATTTDIGAGYAEAALFGTIDENGGTGQSLFGTKEFTTNGSVTRTIYATASAFDDSRFGTLTISTAAHTQIFAPVPEPSEVAMLLSGLGIAGVYARTRRKAAPARALPA